MTETFNFTRADWPEGFTFGAATSAYQIEGHGFGGAGRTHWDDFATGPGNVVRAEHGQRACDHYHKYPEDFGLMKAAGLDAYRFSTSWARVMPDGVNVNPEGLDFYDKLTDAILENGLEPHATLYHWELPSALADIGGWRNRDVVMRFADLTRVVMERIGDRMASVAPVNELWCVSWLSHFEGHHAPGLRDLRAAARAMHHVGLAHGLSIQVMRDMGLRNLGAVCNFEYAHPADDTPEAAAAARLYDGIYNRWFTGGIFHGQYPDDILEGLAPHMPENWHDDMGVISSPVDWLGINYYTCKRIASAPGPWPAYQDVAGPLPKTQMDWEIYPEGLGYFLRWVRDTYTGDLPLYITENGMANADHVGVPDTARINYLNAHFAAAQSAIADGVPLKAYFLWSLLDNYEWAFGYEKRFGMIHVDFETLVRTPKASYTALQRALSA